MKLHRGLGVVVYQDPVHALWRTLSVRLFHYTSFRSRQIVEGRIRREAAPNDPLCENHHEEEHPDR